MQKIIKKYIILLSLILFIPGTILYSQTTRSSPTQQSNGEEGQPETTPGQDDTGKGTNTIPTDLKLPATSQTSSEQSSAGGETQSNS